MDKNKRLISLDMFRGLTIAAMILVSNPGTWDYVYHPLTHAPWHNITPTDLVFPFFIFIMGISIVLALSKQLKSNIPKKRIYGKIALRSFNIMVLGILLNMYPSFNFSSYGWSGIGYTGVLPRIAIVYLFCAVLFLNTNWKVQSLIAVILLLFYWLAMCFIPVPGMGRGILEPGNNMAAWIDSIVLSIDYGKWVPEGFFSTFPAFVTGISGMLVGKLLLSNNKQSDKLIWLMISGILAFGVGTIWGWVFPINKNIWTSSFVLYSTGLAILILSLCIYCIDFLGYERWARFGVIFGSNAITIYVLSHLIAPFVFYRPVYSGQSISSLFMNTPVSGTLSPYFLSFLFAVLYTLFCFIPAYFMYRKKLFIKV